MSVLSTQVALHAAVAIAPVDRPDHVTEPAAQLVGDLLGGAFAEGGEVKRVGPPRGAVRGDEPAEQVLDDAFVLEQAFVGGASMGLRRFGGTV